MTDKRSGRRKHLTFREWLERDGRPQREVAREIGIHQASVYRLALPAPQTSLETAFAVEAYTGGEVPAWIHLPMETRRRYWGERGRP